MCNSYCDLLVYVAIVLACTSSGIAAVIGFEESFDGNGTETSLEGNFTGLDNPGWEIRGGYIEFVDGGLSFYNQPPFGDGADIDSIARLATGAGSFESRIRLTNPYLGDLVHLVNAAPTSAGRIRFFHALDPNNVGRDAISIGLHEFISNDREDDNTSWKFVVVTSGVADGVLVPRGENIEMAMIFNAAKSEATYEYVQDFTDNSVAPIRLGPYPFSGSATDSHLLLTDFSAEDFGAANAVIDHWSLRPFSDVQGDFNGNGILDAGDIDLLSDAIRSPDGSSAFDVDGNDVVDEADRDHWIHGLKSSYYGDSNLDGEFNSRDLTTIFQAAEYEDDVIANSKWATGDWNGDREFSSSDLVRAFQDAGYEQGPRPVRVPEPKSQIPWLLFVACIAKLNRRPDC